jgi:hypothetical protein
MRALASGVNARLTYSCLAERVVHDVRAATPARQHLFRPAQGRPVKVEVCALELRGERGRHVVDEFPAQVTLPVGDGHARQEFVEGLEIFGLRDVDLGELRRVDALQVSRPIEVRRRGLKLRGRHLVVAFVGVAVGDAVAENLRELSLDVQDGLGFGCRFGRVVAR